MGTVHTHGADDDDDDMMFAGRMEREWLARQGMPRADVPIDPELEEMLQESRASKGDDDDDHPRL